jgi:hypothetical protein
VLTGSDVTIRSRISKRSANGSVGECGGADSCECSSVGDGVAVVVRCAGGGGGGFSFADSFVGDGGFVVIVVCWAGGGSEFVSARCVGGFSSAGSFQVNEGSVVIVVCWAGRGGVGFSSAGCVDELLTSSCPFSGDEGSVVVIVVCYTRHDKTRQETMRHDKARENNTRQDIA